MDTINLSNLNEGRTEYISKIHWTSYIKPTIFTFIGLVFVIPFVSFKWWLLAAVFGWLTLKPILKIIQLKSTKITVHSRVLSVHWGILSRTTTDISLKKYEGMRIHQGTFGKLLNYGELKISTGEISQQFRISRPRELRDVILRNA